MGKNLAFTVKKCIGKIKKATEAQKLLRSEWNLCEKNRWFVMAQLISWSEFEEKYAENFSESMGSPAKPFRMALGALIIKEKLRISDRETVEQIKENPYLQYFIGQESYSNEALTHQRWYILGKELVQVLFKN